MVTIVNVIPPGPAQDDQPLPVAAIPTQAAAFRALARLVLGDVAVLAGLNVATPPHYNGQDHEWGLGYDFPSSRWILVRGGPGATRYINNGLETVFPYAHTHPTDPQLPTIAAKTLATLGNDGLDGLAGRTLAAVCVWLANNAANGAMIDWVQGLAPVFPSNADLTANYTIGGDRTTTGGRRDRRPRKLEGVTWPATGVEIVYPTCFIDAGGWVSPNAADTPLQVTFGPTTAELVADATTNAGLHDAQVVRWFYAPLELTAAGRQLWNGVIKADPTNANRAWLANHIPGGTVTRVEAAGLTNNRA